MTINVTRSSMPPFEEYTEEIKDIWQSHWLTNMGVKHHFGTLAASVEPAWGGYYYSVYFRFYNSGYCA